MFGLWCDKHWLDNSEMTHQTFSEIVSLLKGWLLWHRNTLCKPMLVEKHIAIGIWYLANTNSYKEDWEQCSIGLSTVGENVLVICFAMELHLLCKTVLKF